MKYLLNSFFILIISNQLVFASSDYSFQNVEAIKNFNQSRTNISLYIKDTYKDEPKIQNEIQDFWKTQKHIILPAIKYENNKFILNESKESLTVALETGDAKGFTYNVNAKKYYYDFEKTFTENLNVFKSNSISTSMINFLIPKAEAQIAETIGVLIGVGIVLTIVVKEMISNAKESLLVDQDFHKLEDQIKIINDECENRISVSELNRSTENLKKIIDYYNKSSDNFDSLCRNPKEKYKHVSDTSLGNLLRICANYSEAKMCIRSKINASAINNSSNSKNKEKIIYQKAEDKYSISK